MAVGMMFIVTGVVLLSAAGLVTGGIAGIALLVSYVAPLSVGTIFTLVNVPFFVFAYFVMGPRFAIKSTLASCGITLLLA
ncbi:YitT family protein, partial [Acinetobacter baumannii]